MEGRGRGGFEFSDVDARGWGRGRFGAAGRFPGRGGRFGAPGGSHAAPRFPHPSTVDAQPALGGQPAAAPAAGTPADATSLPLADAVAAAQKLKGAGPPQPPAGPSPQGLVYAAPAPIPMPRVAPEVAARRRESAMARLQRQVSSLASRMSGILCAVHALSQ